MTIDFHTHVFEDRTAARVLRDMGERARIPSYTDGTLGGLVASMDAAGIGVSVVSRITTRPEQVGAVNGWLHSIQGPRIVPLATMHPAAPDACEQVGRLREQGFRGFKLHPDYQGFHVDEARLFPFYEAVEAAGMWVLFHAGLDRGLPGREVHATPERLARVVKAFPRLPVVAAHMGGEDVYEETEAHLLGSDIYLDTSFVLRKMPLGTLRRFTEKHAPERILFGTDSPWGHQREDLAFLRSLSFLSSTVQERITAGNAAALLGIRPHDG